MTIANGLTVPSIDERVGQRIRRARHEAGMTLAQLAKKLNLSSSIAVSRYESGQRQVSLGTLEIIARSTGKSIIWFMIDDQNDAEIRNGWVKLEVIFRELLPATQESLLSYAEYLHYRQCQQLSNASIQAHPGATPNSLYQNASHSVHQDEGHHSGAMMAAEDGKKFQ